MKLRYKTLIFLTLLIFCVGSVCAADPDNNSTVNSNLTDDQKVINEVNNIVNTALEKKNAEIKALQNNDIKQSNEIQQLKENNTQLDKRVKDLEYSNLTQSNRIKSLEIDIKNLEDSNKALNVKIDNQSVIINELNNKLDLQLIEIKQLNADKGKLQADIKQLNAEKCSIYEKLLSSPKKEDYEQLKKDITNKNKDIINKDNKIKELNTKIKILNNILNINKKDVYNSLKALSTTNIQNIKCGKYTFKLEDYLKIPLIKEGKKNVLKFKKDNGRLPNYVIIGDYKVSKNIYKKIFNILI